MAAAAVAITEKNPYASNTPPINPFTQGEPMVTKPDPAPNSTGLAPIIAAPPPKDESLSSKMARIAHQIGDKEPQRHSRDIKFPYHSARDVYGWWRPLLEAEGIIIVPKVLSVTVQAVTIPARGGGTRHTFLTTMDCQFTVRDGRTGEWLEGSALGQGEDPSDKGAGKAMTYAQKNFLLALGMNGSEPDVEAYDNSQRDDRDDRRPNVTITDSNIEGIQRGGRARMATEAQIAAVRTKAHDMGIGIRGVAEFVYAALGRIVDLPTEPQEAAVILARFLSNLSSEDIGMVIAKMDQQQGGSRTNDEDRGGGPDDDTAGYGEGYDS